MKSGIAFANVGPFGQPDHLDSRVTSAEENGIESLWTVEHVVPVGYESPCRGRARANELDLSVADFADRIIAKV